MTTHILIHAKVREMGEQDLLDIKSRIIAYVESLDCEAVLDDEWESDDKARTI